MDALAITFREGIEAVLVVGIMIAFLRRSGRDTLVRATLLGAMVAVLFSVAAAIGLSAAGINADNPLVEAILYLLASVAVTTMVVWMFKAGRRLQQGIETRMSGILSRPDDRRSVRFALFAFAFLMVAREGVETVLFLAAAAVGRGASVTAFVGAVAGIAFAVVYGVLFLRGSALIDLRLFFGLTAGVLGLLALKLLGGSIHEFEEIGLIPMSQTLAHVFDWIAASTAIDWLFLIALSVPLIAPLAKRLGGKRLEDAAQH